jgi:5-methylcytosine-specific restriction endonuclease McrA
MGKDTGLYHRNRTILRERTKRTGAPCYYCGAPFYWGRDTAHPLSFTADHVIPRAAGGSDRMDNLVPAHMRCNRAKSDHIASPATRRTRTATRRW